MLLTETIPIITDPRNTSTVNTTALRLNWFAARAK
jgi:hypothetical protein